ncbi:MAG TPA: ATP-binding protein, partial [Nocardioides sp.]|nr:ATP-binding protein [Nocardioides sp.]
EDVDVAEMAPPLAFGDDDVGEVGRAFNAVQQTAIQATVDQAELKRGVRDIFLSLAHRIQALVHRQLKLIDSMERQSSTEDELANLYRIDHLATRMRRNAENLVVLAGLPPGRTWRTPVAMVDVMRAALAEVEDYQRVRLRAADAGTLSGRAVGDVIHLLAELMENAISFSPPQAGVYVTGIAVQDGYLVEIEDRGLGMTEEDLVAANARIADPPEFQLTSTARLGFFVVGKLAQRYGIRVILRPSSSHGVTAAVILPHSVLGDDTGDGAYLPETAPEPLAPIGVARVRQVAVAPESAEPSLTPAGLPMRVRRPVAPASLSTSDSGLETRTPQEVSRIFAAYADAARRGGVGERGD